MNKSAKEMFEELGYKQEIYISSIYYYGEDSDYDYYYIAFDKLDKSIKINKYINEITIEELKAINKQIEELGWNNE